MTVYNANKKPQTFYIILYYKNVKNNKKDASISKNNEN